MFQGVSMNVRGFKDVFKNFKNGSGGFRGVPLSL